MSMPAETTVAFIAKVQRRLPRTLANKWNHLFLNDISRQIGGGYRQRLSTKQTAHLLMAADLAGVDLPSEHNGDQSTTNPLVENDPHVSRQLRQYS